MVLAEAGFAEEAATHFRDGFDALSKRQYQAAEAEFSRGLRLDDRDANAWLYYYYTISVRHYATFRREGSVNQDTRKQLEAAVSKIKELNPSKEQLEAFLSFGYEVLDVGLTRYPAKAERLREKKVCTVGIVSHVFEVFQPLLRMTWRVHAEPLPASGFDAGVELFQEEARKGICEVLFYGGFFRTLGY